MIDYTQTVFAQYKNAPSINRLIDSFNRSVDPRVDFAAWHANVWDIDTAQGFGLDTLGRIVDVSRIVNVRAIYPALTAPGNLSLNDADYRSLIKTKILTNISNTSAQESSAAMRTLFAGQGKALVTNIGDMKGRFVCLFAPKPWQYSVFLDALAIPRSAGVKYDLLTVNNYWGFSEAQSWQPFGQAPFAAY